MIPKASKMSCLWISAIGGSRASMASSASQTKSIHMIVGRRASVMVYLKSSPEKITPGGSFPSRRRFYFSQAHIGILCEPYHIACGQRKAMTALGGRRHFFDGFSCFGGGAGCDCCFGGDEGSAGRCCCQRLNFCSCCCSCCGVRSCTGGVGLTSGCDSGAAAGRCCSCCGRKP